MCHPNQQNEEWDLRAIGALIEDAESLSPEKKMFIFLGNFSFVDPGNSVGSSLTSFRIRLPRSCWHSWESEKILCRGEILAPGRWLCPHVFSHGTEIPHRREARLATYLLIIHSSYSPGLLCTRENCKCSKCSGDATPSRKLPALEKLKQMFVNYCQLCNLDSKSFKGCV